jgi:hypothetical protein
MAFVTPGKSSAIRAGVWTANPAGTAVSGLGEIDPDHLGAGLGRAGYSLDRVLRMGDGKCTEGQQTQPGGAQPLCHR